MIETLNNKLVIVYKNIIILVPDGLDILLVLGALRHAVGNSIVMNSNRIYTELLKNTIPEENFFYNIPYTNKFINNQFITFEHRYVYQGLCKVDQIKSDIVQYTKDDVLSLRLGDLYVEKVYKIAKYDIRIPDVFELSEIQQYYAHLEFIQGVYGEIPVLEKRYTVLKEVDSKDGVMRRLCVSPSYPNIIINHVKRNGVSEITTDTASSLLGSYNYVFKYNVSSRYNLEHSLEGWLLFRDSITNDELVHLDTSGFNCNLANIDIIYMLAQIAVSGRTTETPYLKITPEGTMFWTSETTDIFIPRIKANLDNINLVKLMELMKTKEDRDKNFWTKNRNIF